MSIYSISRCTCSCGVDMFIVHPICQGISQGGGGGGGGGAEQEHTESLGWIE